MSHNIRFFQRSLALQAFLTVILFFISTSIASEPNYAVRPDIEQAKKTVKQLRDRYKKVKNSVETALSDARRRYALQRNDATSVDPCELAAAKRDEALLRRKEALVRQVSKVLKDISPLIASAEELGYGDYCVDLAPNHSPLVFGMDIQFEVRNGRIVPPSASYLADSLHMQSAILQYELFSDLDSHFGFDESIHDIYGDKSHSRAVFIHVDRKGEDLAIRLIDNTVIARTEPFDGISVEVTFPYSSRSKAPPQARQESRKIEAKQVPPELIDRQRRELRELVNVKNSLDELDQYIIKIKRMLDANSDNLDQAKQEIDNLAKLIADAELATQKELVRIHDKYQQQQHQPANFTNSVGMYFTMTADGNYVLTNDESSEEPAKVTLGQWEKVIARQNKSDSDALDQPVVVSRAEALKFCENLSRKEGRRYYLFEETKIEELQQKQRDEAVRPSGSSASSEDNLITFSVSVDADQSVSEVLNEKIGGNEDD